MHGTHLTPQAASVVPLAGGFYGLVAAIALAPEHGKSRCLFAAAMLCSRNRCPGVNAGEFEARNAPQAIRRGPVMVPDPIGLGVTVRIITPAGSRGMPRGSARGAPRLAPRSQN